MPAFPDEAPPEGLNVNVTLTGGLELVAYYAAGQWWTGLPDSGEDVPLSNEHVAAWTLIS